MTEDMIFARRRFDPYAAKRFGFTLKSGKWRYDEELPEGDLIASIAVAEDGKTECRVIDKMNDEEFLPLRAENYQGAYIGAVRSAYEDLLRRIADECFKEVIFAHDQSNRIAVLIKERYGVEPDFPFDEEPHKKSGVFRHPENLKWFALMMDLTMTKLTKDGDTSPVGVVNLKADKDLIPSVIEKDGVFPAYHMNHKHWISVTLNDVISDEEVMSLVADSFDLTKKK